MTFLSVVLALLIERFAAALTTFRQHDLIQRWYTWLDVRLGQYRVFDGWLGVAAMLLPAVLVADWVYEVFDGWLFGAVGIALAVAILVFSLGPKDIDRALEGYLRAAPGSTERDAIHAEITGEAPTPAVGERLRQLVRGAFVEANHRLFGVLFWFVAAGPIGALTYRLSKELFQNEREHLGRLRGYAEIWFGLLNWLPVRLLTFTLALTGGFDEVWAVCRARFTQYPEWVHRENGELLGDAGAAATGLDAELQQGVGENTERRVLTRTMNVLRRTLVAWVVLLAVLTLLRWV